MKKRHVLILLTIFLLTLTGCFVSEKEETANSGYKPDSVQKFYMYIASDGLNVRKGPGADTSVVTVLHRNDKVVTDKISHDGWYKIASVDESAEGYVNAAYLTDKPVSEEEIAAEKAAAEASKQAASSATRSVNPDAGKTSTTASESDTSTQRPTLSKRPKN
ncbi:MAG: SH3 domain-containing protein [Treponema sp.]|nr:SH3 domain-containing protein [Candidatus Treponema caballi]